MDLEVLIIVGANLATILAVLGSLLKISSDFGSMKTQVENNKNTIEKHDTRIVDMEKVVF